MATDLKCQHKTPRQVEGRDLFEYCGATTGVELTEVGPRCPQHAPPLRHPHGQRIRAITAAKALTLDRRERHELAEMLVGHRGSWKNLNEKDAKRIADACDAFLAIQALLMMRRDRG
jgi:hypothetical protein